MALDSAGEEAAGKFYDRAGATFTTLIDVRHTVGELYGMVNVPTGVWIDEEGRIVRPPEVAYSKEIEFLGQKLGDTRYVPALRDWVAHGAESRYLMSADRLAQRLAPSDEPRRRAKVLFQMGLHFHRNDNERLANRYWERSQKADPENWNHHRQDWSYNTLEASLKFGTKVLTLDGPYYEPIEMPDD